MLGLGNLRGRTHHMREALNKAIYRQGAGPIIRKALSIGGNKL